MKAGFSAKLIFYLSRIVLDELSRRIVQRRIVRAELSGVRAARQLLDYPGRTYSRVRHTRAGRTLEYVLPGL